ncbi:hypothetical protein [Aliivibrio kagoshimensis]|jgi:hypothetical protein|uniref:hypothetical protein n=1 Tax=Aliivibrio kagoshimensis TaxID=2910230 RepID=UPI003D0C1E18
MSQAAMNLNVIDSVPAMDQKAYAVNFKGLIAHIRDIFIGKDEVSQSRYVSELSSHLQKDIGMYR